MIQRAIFEQIKARMFSQKTILLLGARQVGKTTLLKQLSKAENVLWLDADEEDVKQIFENANSSRIKQIIGENKIVVIDEAQLIKDIGRKIKLLVDKNKDIQIIATGLSTLDLNNKTAETLTGRKWEFNLFPFSFQELANNYGVLEEKRNLQTRLVYGSYPEIVTHAGDEKARLKALSSSYLYKDILMLDGIQKPEKLFQLLKALALQVGKEVSINNLSSLLGISNNTIEKYINLLEKSFIIFRLNAYSSNQYKELSKSKKIYFYDNGIRNAIVGDFTVAENRLDIGQVWENYIVSEIVKKCSYENNFTEAFFWRTVDQQEIDLVLKCETQLAAFEIKWNPNAKARLSKTFIKNYGDIPFAVINTENYADILLNKLPF